MKHLQKLLVNIFLPTMVIVMVLYSNVYAQKVDNPLGANFPSISAFISGALRVMVKVALPIISLAIVYSGFLFVFARGNSTKLENAKRNFLYVAIGTVLILGAWMLANLLAGTIAELLPN